MKIIKKNQLTILVIALMLITAGYLNYTSNDEAVETSSSLNVLNETDLAGIGDAKLVNSSDVIENSIEVNDIDTNNEKDFLENKYNNSENNTIETSSNISVDEYFIKSRLDRETMYSQMIETYQKILESSSISNEQKVISGQEIDNINKTKNAIMISENLIKTKGFEDCILFINDKSINVIIKKNELLPEDIAQIQNIVSRELGAEIENIHISNK